MKLPDSLFKRAKTTAARKGQTMTSFVSAAIEAKLNADESAASEKPWMQYAGIFCDENDLEESEMIMERIHEACGQIDEASWK